MKLSYRSKSTAGALFLIVLLFAVVIGAIAGAFWLLWVLWTFVLGQVWPDGPLAVVSPGYLLFVAEWILIGLIGRRIFGRSEKSK